MKLYTYQTGNDGVDRLGVECSGWPGMLWPVEAFGLKFNDMHDLICRIGLNPAHTGGRGIGGMMAATFIGTFFIPLFWTYFARLSEFIKRKFQS